MQKKKKWRVGDEFCFVLRETEWEAKRKWGILETSWKQFILPPIFGRWQQYSWLDQMTAGNCRSHELSEQPGCLAVSPRDLSGLCAVASEGLQKAGHAGVAVLLECWQLARDSNLWTLVAPRTRGLIQRSRICSQWQIGGSVRLMDAGIPLKVLRPF